MDAGETRVTGCGALIQVLADGAFLLDPDRRVVCMNAEAGRLCGDATGLHVLDERLHADSPAAEAALQRLIDRAVDGVAQAAPSVIDELLLPDSTGARTLSVLACALRARPWTGGRSDPAAVVFVTDLAARPRIPGPRLAALYGMTAAEVALVLRLADGASLAEVSRHTGRSPGTLRSHLKRIFIKTGTHRQADLVRLLMRHARRR